MMIEDKQPLFESWAVEEADAVDRAVTAYQAKKITRAEMVERVRAIIDQYDGFSRELMFDEIEEKLGHEVAELWTPRKKRRADTDNEGGE